MLGTKLADDPSGQDCLARFRDRVSQLLVTVPAKAWVHLQDEAGFCSLAATQIHPIQRDLAMERFGHKLWVPKRGVGHREDEARQKQSSTILRPLASQRGGLRDLNLSPPARSVPGEAFVSMNECVPQQLAIMPFEIYRQTCHAGGDQCPLHIVTLLLFTSYPTLSLANFAW